MRKDQKAKIVALKSVHKVLGNNTSIWNGVPKMGEEFENLGTQLALIEELIVRQVSLKKGVVIEKNNAIRELFEDAMVLSSALRNFAIENNELALFEKTKLINSDLKRLTSIDLQVRLEVIAENVDAYKDFIVEWGISPEKSANFVNQVSLANSIFLAYREKRQESVINTLKLASELKKANLRVKSVIGGLILQFKKTAPSFLAIFEKALRSDKTGSKPSIDFESGPLE